jgi:hypothetical protein
VSWKFFVAMIVVGGVILSSTIIFSLDRSQPNISNVDWECVQWLDSRPISMNRTYNDFKDLEDEAENMDWVGVTIDRNEENLTMTYINYNVSKPNRTSYIINSDQDYEDMNYNAHFIDLKYTECNKYRKIKTGVKQ